ncbi:sugar O-acetyltransferase [Ligilactobacillus sp. WILCCON 0076]|uniref:Acetyltransferase n=1 Tax=Ligilactobacillus ubinensis TaxID=2876789 RepID=A0A9X2FGL2_9LACO|nr:sugar O-acetyltransferase [Ligilactobacillus ubinensis]MCP0886012.1 sugar O-acetyltransferase [Ligilactobacillus ubinensis]
MDDELIERIKAITNNGELYYDYNDDIDLARKTSFEICRDYNNGILHRNKYDLKKLKKLFAYLGENVRIEANFLTEFGFNLSIGNNVTILQDVSFIDCARLIIEDNVIIGPHCGIYTSNHAQEPELRKQHYCYEQPIKIRENVCLGGGVLLCPGVTIGKNTMVLPGSVVVNDLPANVVAAGNPCQKIRALAD